MKSRWLRSASLAPLSPPAIPPTFVHKAILAVVRDNGLTNTSQTIYTTFYGFAATALTAPGPVRLPHRGVTASVDNVAVDVASNARVNDTVFSLMYWDGATETTLGSVTFGNIETGSKAITGGPFSLADGHSMYWKIVTLAGSQILVWSASGAATYPSQTQQQLFCYSADTAIAQGATVYMRLTNLNTTSSELTAQIIIPCPGVIDLLQFQAQANTLTVPAVITARKGGVPQLLSVSVTGLTLFEDTRSFAVVAGDVVSLQAACAAGSGNISGFSYSIRFTPTGSNQSCLWSGSAQGQTIASFSGFSGRGPASLSEPPVKLRAPFNLTLSNMYAAVNANTLAVTPVSIRSRINSSNGSLLVSVPTNGATGVLTPDTTNVDTITAGQMINASFSTASGGGSATYTGLTALLTAT